MNSLTIGVIFVALFCTVYSETCTTASDCSHTLCDNTSRLECNANGICECIYIVDDLSCTSVDKCLALTDWFCPDFLRHCYDGRCRCIFIPAK